MSPSIPRARPRSRSRRRQRALARTDEGRRRQAAGLLGLPASTSSGRSAPRHHRHAAARLKDIRDDIYDPSQSGIRMRYGGAGFPYVGGEVRGIDGDDRQLHLCSAQLTVKVGDTVTWKNHDDIPQHRRCRQVQVETLDTDDSFSFTFTAAGDTIFLFTEPHMTGTIKVE